MKKTTVASVALCASLMGFSHAQDVAPGTIVTATSPEEREIVGTTPYLEGQVIVRFSEATTREEAIEALVSERFFVDRVLMRRLDMYLVQILDGTPVLEVIAELEENPRVAYASPDHLVYERATTPNDTRFSQQWAMHNTGGGGGVPDADIDAVEAWDIGTGSHDFVVAVVDGGMDRTHADLQGNLFQNLAEVNGATGVDDDGNGYVDDKYGWDAYSNDGSIPTSNHGTHVGGIVGARGNNSIGVAGVNWDVTVMPVAGSSSSTSIVLLAYGYVEDMKALWISSGGAQGANVVATNSSFGIDYANCNSSPYTQWNDAYDDMGALGILSAAATMNIDANVDSSGDVPTGCSSNYLVTVTNTTSSDQRAYAGYGAVSIDLGAPGSSIVSCLDGGGYGSMSGTSMATPHVAGAVAFMHSVASASFTTLRSADPAAAALELKTLMLDNVDVIAALNGITVSDGRLNLNNAAIAIRDWGGGADPYAGFSATPTSGDEDLLVTFTDLSTGTGISTWQWDFGDSGTSTLQHPTHLYPDPGTYTVSLTVTGTNGSDDATKTGYIEVFDVFDASFATRNGSGVNPDIFTSTSLPILGTDWTSEVDAGSIGVGGFVFVFVYSGALPGAPTAFGELLLDPAASWLFTDLAVAFGGIAQHAIAVPVDPIFAGNQAYAQAYLNSVAPSGQLTNAIDLVLGY
jgi:PKD repeat protein